MDNGLLIETTMLVGHDVRSLTREGRLGFYLCPQGSDCTIGLAPYQTGDESRGIYPIKEDSDA